MLDDADSKETFGFNSLTKDLYKVLEIINSSLSSASQNQINLENSDYKDCTELEARLYSISK